MANGDVTLIGGDTVRTRVSPGAQKCVPRKERRQKPNCEPASRDQSREAFCELEAQKITCHHVDPSADELLPV